MKRPLACFGFSFFTVLLCLNLIDNTAFSLSLLVGIGVLFVISLLFRKSRQSVFLPVVLSAMITGCLLMLIFENNYNNICLNAGENASVRAVVTQKPEFSREYGRYYSVVRVREINGVPISTKMRISFSETKDEIDNESIEIGDKLRFTATVYRAGDSDEGVRRYYKSRGIYLGAHSLSDFSAEKSNIKPIGHYINLLRDKVTENLFHDFDGDVSALLVALLTGDKSHMSDEMYDSFIKAGIVHIMAVSGLHLSIWVGFISLFIDFSGKRKRLMSLFMILFVIFMMNFACFTGSVKRAAAMTILFFIGKIFSKEADSLNSLGFAAVCALIINPFGVLDISFLLSFLATLGIIVTGIPLSDFIGNRLFSQGEKLRKIAAPFVATFSFSIAVAIFTFPVSLFYFSGFSLVSALSNMLIVFAVSPLLLITGLYSFIRFVPFLSHISALIMKHLSLYVIGVAELTEGIPLSYVRINDDYLAICFAVAFAVFILAVAFYRFDNLIYKFLLASSLSVFLFSVLMSFGYSYDRAAVRVYPEDKGGAAVVSLGGRGVVIGFDGDSYAVDELTEEIEDLGIKIDCVLQNSIIFTSQQKRLYHNLSAENILTQNNTSVTLFDRVTVKIKGESIEIECEDVKTDIFICKSLQEEEKCDIINKIVSDGSENSEETALRVKYKTDSALILKGKDIVLRGENIWQSLMKKALKVT